MFSTAQSPYLIMEKGILACNEGKELFMRVWPIVSSWRKEQFMRKCVMAKEQFMHKWWSIWVDAEPPPLVDSSDEEPRITVVHIRRHEVF